MRFGVAKTLAKSSMVAVAIIEPEILLDTIAVLLIAEARVPAPNISTVIFAVDIIVAVQSLPLTKVPEIVAKESISEMAAIFPFMLILFPAIALIFNAKFPVANKLEDIVDKPADSPINCK